VIVDEKKPIEIINELYEARVGWSDEDILRELAGLPELPDGEDGPWFGEKGYLWAQQETLQNADLYLALARHVAVRRLKPGVRFLLERASYGDFGEIMRGMCHIFEAAFKGHYSELGDLCSELMHYPRPGTKLWALDQLARLRDRRAIPELLKALYYPVGPLCEYACMYLEWYYRDFADDRDEIERGLKRYIELHTRNLRITEETLEKLLQVDK